MAIKSNEVLIHATTWRNIENMVSKRKAQSFSHVQLFTSPWTVACQAPVNGILGARILESVAIFFSKGAYLPRMETASLASPILADRFFTTVPPMYIDVKKNKSYPNVQDITSDTSPVKNVRVLRLREGSRTILLSR